MKMNIFDFFGISSEGQPFLKEPLLVLFYSDFRLIIFFVYAVVSLVFTPTLLLVSGSFLLLQKQILSLC